MTTITAHQASNITALEARTGRSWTEFADVPVGTPVADLPKDVGIAVLKSLMAAAGIKPAQPIPASTGLLTGQSGRCAECGAALNGLSAGGYCYDCQ